MSVAGLSERSTGVYIHWPFCASKCPYCDFNSHVRESVDQAAWQKAYERSIEYYAVKLGRRKISSIYFGGGTPSLMPPETVASIIDNLSLHFDVEPAAEITLEANPTSVEGEKFKAFRAAGVNRLSIGVQALRDDDLRFLGRKHNVSEAMQAIQIASENFDRYSFDLIYARPDQTLKDWGQELEEAVKLSRGHLSLYQLTIERTTPFYYDYMQGKFSMPQQELAADFYNLTQDVLEAHDYPAYEVSNHAVAEQESRHNLTYWRYGDYIGIGPGAHGRLTMDGEKYATREHQAPEIWLSHVEEKGSGVHTPELIAPQDQFQEALMMGLRLRGGVSLSELSAETGYDGMALLDQSRIQTVCDEGWANMDDDHITLSREGLLRLNAILPFILKDDEAVSAA